MPKEAKIVTDAVDAWRRYYGSVSAPVGVQQRMHRSAMKKVAQVAAHYHMSESAAFDQITHVAASRGALSVTPGKDY